MTTRMRALVAICAITLTTFALATTAGAAPADFTWSTSLSTAQAGGHPNITMSYSSSSAQSLTRLDVDLPQGLMHRNNMSGACSNPLYQSDSCPATSTLGSVTAQLEVARVPINVLGTIYQLSEPSGGADATFGIVLRPPLSSLGLTSKIYLRDQISFTNGGGLRHSLVGPLTSVSALGVSLPSRVAQLALTFNGQSNGLALTNNPTSCRTQQFTATGTFSDGTTRPRTSSYATTGCPAVPFSPTGDVQIDNSAPNQRTSFAILLGNSGSGSSAQLHPGHVVAIGHDFEQIGDFDLKMLDGAPSCSDAQAATSPLSCPADSKVFDLSADIEGFGTVTGKVFKTNSPGHKTVGEITLRQGVTTRFTGAIGGDNLSTLTFAGLPQLPLTAIRIKSSTPSLWITNTCAIRTARMVTDSYSGARSERLIPAPTPVCGPPVAPTITAGPERGITINTSHVEYRFTSPESDVTFECKKDDAAYAKCASPFIDDWQGEGVHNFAVRGVRGGVVGPAAIATFTIDTIGPALAFDDPADADKDSDGLADAPFRDQGFWVTVAIGDADPATVTSTFQNTEIAGAPKRPGNGPRPHTQGHVQVGGAALMEPGTTIVTVTASDKAGNATVITRSFVVDGSPPSIAIDEPGVHFAEGPAVEIPITVSDDSLRYDKGEVTLECSRKGWDGTIKGGNARVITDRDSGRSKGFCVFDDVPEGTYKVTVKGWDPVKKEGIAETDLVVDRTPPTADLADPPGSAFRDTSFAILFSASDEYSGIDEEKTNCELRSESGADVVVAGSHSISGGYRSCDFTSAPGGPALITINVVDGYGHVTVLKSRVIIDDSAPSIAIDEPGVHFAGGPDVEIPITAADDSLRYVQGEIEIECAREFPSGVETVPAAKVITDRDTGRSKGFCVFNDVPDGSYKVKVRGWDPVKKEAVAETDLVVDRTAPAVALTNTGDADLDGDGLADEPFRVPSFEVPFTASDDGSGIDKKNSACGARTVDGGTIKSEITFKDDGSGVCSLTGLPGGPLTVELRVHNWVGWVTIVKIAVIVDTEPPSIAIDEPGVHITDAGDAEVPFAISDDSLKYPQGDVTFECERKGWDGTIKGSGKKTVMDRDHGLAKGVCTFSDVPAGSYKVTVKGWDPVKKESIAETDLIVDRDPPAPEPPTIRINSPLGQAYTRGSTVTVNFTVVGTGTYTYKCLVDNVVVLASCPSPSVFSTSSMAYGLHTFKVVATDEFGNDYSASSTFSVIESSGVTVCVAIYPPPPGCPGYIPPGGGVIIVP